MHILPINTSNPKFNGKIIKKGHWTDGLSNVFDSLPNLEELQQGKRDVIAKMSKSEKRYPVSLKYRFSGSHKIDVYKLTLTSVPSEPTFWDKVKMFFGLMPSVSWTRHYHREYSTEDLIRLRFNPKKFASKLKLNS